MLGGHWVIWPVLSEFFTQPGHDGASAAAGPARNGERTAGGDAGPGGRASNAAVRSTKAKKTVLDLQASEAPDLNTLLDLARQKSRAGRQAVFATVKDLFFQSEGTLSDRERALMGDILHKLVVDVERSLRKDLSERLAKRTDAPRELVLTLANDEFEVAHPVLSKSTVLHDSDLIEIVRHRTQQHQLCIAMRKDVSETVSAALVETGDTNVITTLLENGDASISNHTIEYLVAESKRVDSFQMPLVNRGDLPPDLAHKMYWWVSATLRQHIVENYNVDATVIDDTIEATVKDALERGDGGGGGTSEAEELAARMAKRGQLSEEFMLKALRGTEVALFEACFAKATDVRLKLARRLLYEPGGEGLAMACKAAGFKRATFATIFELTRKAAAPGAPLDARELARVSEFYDHVKRDDATAVVMRWRRDESYLRAQLQIANTA